MKLSVILRVKARWLRIDWFKIEKTFEEVIPVTLPEPLDFKKILFDDRGVYLEVNLAG